MNRTTGTPLGSPGCRSSASTPAPSDSTALRLLSLSNASGLGFQTKM